jgi:hypothetical protein
MRGARLWMHDNVDGRKDVQKNWTGENRSLVVTQKSHLQLPPTSPAYFQSRCSCVALTLDLAICFPVK